MLQVVILLVIAWIFYKVIISFSNNKIQKQPEQKTIELIVKLEIQNNEDLENAYKKLSELEDYSKKVKSKKDFLALNNAISKLKQAIFQYEKTIHSRMPPLIIKSYTETNFLDNTDDNDNYEGTFYGGVNDEIPYIHNYRLVYRDGKGKKTERDITTTKIGEDFDDDIMLLAYCHKRKANRSFFASRMIELIDLDTGEVVKDKKAHFRDKIKDYINSPEYLQMLKEQERLKYQYEFIEKNKDLFDIISYIVRVDGSFNPKERQIVHEYVKKIETSEHLDDTMVDKIMRNFGLITYQSFQNKVRKLQVINAIPFDLLEFTKEIVATQKTVSEAEQKIINYLEKRKEEK